MSEQKLTAGCLCEGKLSAGVNRAEVVEILRTWGKSEKMYGADAGLNTEETVKRQLSDASLHMVLHLTRQR